MSESSIDKSINLGAMSEALNDKMDRDGLNADIKPAAGYGVDYVVEWKTPTASDLTWYRKYASGWVEQGGRTYSPGSSAQNITINLPIQMVNTNYSITTGGATGGSPGDGYAFWLGTYYNLTTVSFILKVDGTSYVSYISWEVKGMAV